MKPVKLLGLAGLAAVGLFAGEAMATTCPTSPIDTNGTQTCIATNSPLQGELNAITKGGPDIDIFNDQFSPTAHWSIGGTGSSENTLMFEIANAGGGGQTFGIYDPGNTANMLSLFTSTQITAGDSTSLHYDGGGKYTATYFDASGTELSQSSMTFSAGNNNLFGYYLTTPNGTFFSDSTLNTGAGQSGNPYSDGMHQMVAYQGNGSSNICITGPTACGTFDSGEYILAWTGSPFGTSNLDYNDFVAMVESVTPVPEPGDLGLFGLGVLLLGGVIAIEKRREAHRA